MLNNVEESQNGFKPEIVAFCCHYCAYAAADLAGSLRLEYPTSIKIIEFPCSGKIDVIYVLRAIEEGADGVLTAGCMEGDCHFLEGNYNARRRINYIKMLLKEIGLESERIRMINISAAMGSQFAELTTEFTKEIRELGPNPLKKKV